MNSSDRKVITLCGSSRFEPLFLAWKEVLSLAGHLVFDLASYPSQRPAAEVYPTWMKEELDAVYFEKISRSDIVLFLNVFGYMGESSLRELEHAKTCRLKRVEELRKFASMAQTLGAVPNEFAHAYSEAASGERDRYASPRIYFLESWGNGVVTVGRNSRLDDYIALAKKFGVPEGYSSPIQSCDYPCWPHDLLGPAGAKRSALIERLQKHEERAGFTWR